MMRSLPRGPVLTVREESGTRPSTVEEGRGGKQVARGWPVKRAKRRRVGRGKGGVARWAEREEGPWGWKGWGGPSGQKAEGEFFFFCLFLFVSFFLFQSHFKNKFENILTLIKVTQYKNINDLA